MDKMTNEQFEKLKEESYKYCKKLMDKQMTPEKQKKKYWQEFSKARRNNN